MIHSPPAIAGAHQLAESIVGELIGRPGIDVALIDSLDRIAENSTDALTLESMTGDVAVLDWRSPEQLLSKLVSLGFHGKRSQHADDLAAEVALPGQRRIYAFDLSIISDAKHLLKSLQDLLEARRIKTVSIGGLNSGLPNSTGSASASSNKPAPKTPPTVTRNIREPESQSDITASSDAAPIRGNAADSGSRDSDELLDNLLDQLDLMDP
ncbi:MAG: hypothetical protein WBD20_28025 [Pirellulaceae bacterium]